MNVGISSTALLPVVSQSVSQQQAMSNVMELQELTNPFDFDTSGLIDG